MMRRFEVMSSVPSWLWCCGRSYRPASMKRGHEFEWADVIQDLGQLHTTEVQQDGKRFLLRDEVQGTCGSVFHAAGVALPPTVHQLAAADVEEDNAHSATPVL